MIIHQISLLGTLQEMKDINNCINPLLPIGHKSARIEKILILKLEGIIKKISYERRYYESVDEKSLSKAMSRKNYEKKNSGTNVLKKMKIYIFLSPCTAYCPQRCTN